MSITPLSVFMYTNKSSCCFFFLSYISYSDLCLTFVFSALQVFCCFCSLVMFLCFSDLPLLCLPFCFFWHFCLETYVRVKVFSCGCDRVFTHFVTVIVRLDTGVMCKCTCVNEISCELLPNQHIWPLCHSRFFHMMIQCALDVVRVCCIEWEMELFTYCLLYCCCTWRSSCQNSDVLITLCLYTVDYG